MNVALLGVLDWFESRLPVLERVRRATALARGRALLAGCEVGEHVLVHGALNGALQVERRGRIVVGSRSVFVGGPFPTTLHVGRAGALEIGSDCYFNYGVHFEVRHLVRLGERCMFGSYVQVEDAPGKPVIIGHDVWVAHGAVIHPGVTIGDGAVISAGSVVATDVPAGMLAMGNPARMMSQRLTVPGGPHA
jgi:acetyltransferase-like isoleucine patch superfamily enzyme